MAKILLLISLTLLIGLAVSLPSKPDNSASKEQQGKAGSNEKRNKSNDKHVDTHKKHKHSKDQSHNENSESHERQARHGDHAKNKNHDHEKRTNDESHEKHKKHSKSAHDSHHNDKHDNEKHDNGKHNKHNKNSSSTKKHHEKQTEPKDNQIDSKGLVVDSDDEGWEYENTTTPDTRRVLYSKTTEVGKRPYMVYLQLTKESAKAHKYRGWLCGGVIVERYYVLTSAACVEDADHFYVVSGTIKFVDSFDYKDNDCVCYNRRKVVWKCIPKNYKFDFQDSIKWSSNDIAIVKVNKPFKFGVTEKGCDFATDLISYNNVSRDLEKAGTKAWIAGWGSGSNFREGVYRKSPHIPENAKCLQEAKVCVMDNEQCAKKWSQRFRSIITQYMICTKDVMKRLSEICDKKYANCTDVERRHADEDPESIKSNDIDLGRHLRDPDGYTARRASAHGGFCENDHGGPLIVKAQNKERIIGVISACKIDPKSHSCHGPFLYTSVFKNRQFISCSIYKDTEETCRRVFRTGITHEEWTVDWDNVKEDDDDIKQDDNKNDDDDKEENNDKSSDKSSSDSKESLRTKKKEDQAAAPDVAKSSSKSSEESKEKTKHEKHKKKAERKDKSESEEKQSKKAKPASSDSKSSDSSSSSSSETSEEKRVKRDNRDVFYESSRDENVNEPGSDE